MGNVYEHAIHRWSCHGPGGNDRGRADRVRWTNRCDSGWRRSERDPGNRVRADDMAVRGGSIRDARTLVRARLDVSAALRADRRTSWRSCTSRSLRGLSLSSSSRNGCPTTLWPVSAGTTTRSDLTLANETLERANLHSRRRSYNTRREIAIRPVTQLLLRSIHVISRNGWVWTRRSRSRHLCGLSMTSGRSDSRPVCSRSPGRSRSRSAVRCRSTPRSASGS